MSLLIENAIMQLIMPVKASTTISILSFSMILINKWIYFCAISSLRRQTSERARVARARNSSLTEPILGKMSVSQSDLICGVRFFRSGSVRRHSERRRQ